MKNCFFNTLNSNSLFLYAACCMHMMVWGGMEASKVCVGRWICDYAQAYYTGLKSITGTHDLTTAVKQCSRGAVINGRQG